MRVWDLLGIEPIGPPIDHGCGIDGIATTTLQGSPVAVTSDSRAADLLLWDLAHGELLRRVPTGHPPDSSLIVITAPGHDGLPLAITASRFDYTVRVIDLNTGQAVCRPLEFPTARPLSPSRPRNDSPAASAQTSR